MTVKNLAHGSERERSELPSWVPSRGVGKLIATRDWSQTALGPLATWPASLTQSLRVCLDSRFPFAVAWGPERTQLYNDAFATLCGPKHPNALGQDMRQCWASAWPVLGPSFEQALGGASTYIEDGRLFLDRGGDLEETFATFSFSPLREHDQAAVAGVLLTLIETTGKVLGERRTRLLRDIVTAGAGVASAREAFTVSLAVLDTAARDVPFALIYSVDSSGGAVELVARTRSAPDRACVPRLELDDARALAASWPLAEVVATNRSRKVTDLRARFGSFLCAPYPEPPVGALLLPIALPGAASVSAVLVIAQSPRLALDGEYEVFFERVAAALSTNLASAHAQEAQRLRAEQLSALDRAKTAFFSNVSHEFRTPLTLVAGPLDDELAEREQPLPEHRRERLATARRNTLRLIKLVNNLLDFSRLEAGRLEARYQLTQLGTLTSELVSLFRSALERAGLTLVVEVESLPEPAFVDRDMWEKIVLNLMSNAFKHTFEGGISVRLRAVAGAAELTVADTGIGIAARDLPNLFERFQRVVGARSRTHEGTGIGLALVRELSILHGGDVRVDSTEGRGTTFTVTIPLGHAHLPPEHLDLEGSTKPTGTDVAAYVQEALQWSPVSDVEHSGAPSPDAHGETAKGAARPKVLLADDNADMRAYISGLLQGAYQVAAVVDGQAALELAPTFQPDLVLADVMMPRLGGTELLRALRDDARTRHLPVILLSARAGDDATLEGIEAGADDYLTKPFAARELRARVHTHVALARARREYAEHLEQTNRELEAFSYSVSHDLRTPLRAIDGFSKALLTHKSTQLDDEAKQYLQRVRRAAERMAELIDELLNLSRVSRAPLHRQTLSLTSLAERVAANIAELQPGRTVTLEVAPSLIAYADPRLLQIALENLLENSWKFTRLRVDARVQVGRVADADAPTYFVRDNGAGFDQTYVQRLFQPFQRLHLERDYPGTGIGLAIVHRIIARHGGRVWAEGREHQGATFYFTLPETS